MKKVIGLDMSTTSTGWCLFYDKELETYGCLKETEKDMSIRLINMRNQIKEVLNKNMPDVVIIEEIPISSKANLNVGKSLCVLQGLILGVCADLNIPYIMTAPSKWRAKVGILKSIYTCDKCGHTFEAKSGLKHLICAECGNVSFSRFKKTPLNKRQQLKKRAIEMVNELYDLDLLFHNSKNSNQDDEAESILLARSEIFKSGEKE